MYNKQVATPITIRTPMGGGRGYGPTHSQSIEKIFNGLNNIRIVALNTLIDSNLIFKAIENFKHATILIENVKDNYEIYLVFQYSEWCASFSAMSDLNEIAKSRHHNFKTPLLN